MKLLRTTIELWLNLVFDESGSWGTYRGVSITEARLTAVGILSVQRKVTRYTPVTRGVTSER